MFCKYCGIPVDEDSTFCKSCGKRIDEPSEVQSVEPSFSDASDAAAQTDTDSSSVIFQPNNVLSKVFTVIALVLSFALAKAFGSLDLPSALSSVSSLGQYACVFAVIGVFIRGKTGDILFSTGVFLMCFASFGELAYVKYQGWLGIILVIVGVLFKLCLVLSGRGILVRRKFLITLGGLLNLVGVVAVNLVFTLVFTPNVVQGEYGPALFVLSLLASVSFTLGVITYKTSIRGGDINVL